MQDQRSILVTIDSVGRPKIEAIGFTGGTCKEATKNLLAAFGGAGETVEKPEMGYIEIEGEQHEHLTM